MLFVVEGPGPQKKGRDVSASRTWRTLGAAVGGVISAASIAITVGASGSSAAHPNSSGSWPYTKVNDLPLGAATVSDDLVFTVLARASLIALNRATGAIVYRHTLPTTANAPIAVAGDTVLVPAGALGSKSQREGEPQLVAFRVS
jgi:hypothetical protein